MQPNASEAVSVYNKDLPMTTQNMGEEHKSKTKTLEPPSPFRPPAYSSSTLCDKQRLESMPSTNNAKP